MTSRDGFDEGGAQGSGDDVVPGRVVEARTPIRLSPLTLPPLLARAVLRPEQSTDTPRTQQLLPPDPHLTAQQLAGIDGPPKPHPFSGMHSLQTLMQYL